jgi:prepilin-type N-terminal cleavage/methylation domain-containing protein
MNYEQRTKKGFTLIELLVAIALLAIVISFAGVIFRVSINAYRTAIANVEIMQKLRAITNQLDSDFKGLRKDGEIFVIWSASAVPAGGYQDNDLDGYERFDRIMFFADGDFHSYRVNPMVRGNVARICYTLASKPSNDPSIDPIRPAQQKLQTRILARTQHILTADSTLPEIEDPTNFIDDEQWYLWNNDFEYNKMTLDEWKLIPWAVKANMLSVICDVDVGPSNVGVKARGSMIDPADPNSIHMLLCEGVGEFKIQGWYDDDDQQRWVPEVDPDGDGFLTDTNFFPNQDGTGLHATAVPGVLYPYRTWYDTIDPNSYFLINNMSYPGQMLNQTNFNNIPGLGRALKFTFTLFDSKGIIKEGRIFTHIVYLDD